MADLTLKVCVIGPRMAGKTAICNFLSGMTTPSSEYTPTVGVRILEVEKQYRNSRTVTVELWDCSGDPKYESCWMALQKDCDAVLLVYTPDNPEHTSDKGEVYRWISKFVTPVNLKESQCLVFAHNNPRNSKGGPKQSLSKLSKVTQVSTSLDTEAGKNTITSEFDNFLNSIISSLQQARAAEEDQYMR
eukprot:TRINITY_DN12255_c0_g1::TRINITY_DN12255_c0_g1_i1::g.12962::m.12962 TRINITY_DN12255_c0_g1::TRINITY_DN12255_c0_g1_i1::g.12962  ORF type:complete len:189 (-),score=-0.47,sp/Q567Y6/IFT22_DANRE/38.17/5e-35,Miro/PF08477.8/3.1e-09,Ras/PF00071.17/2.5e-09,Arf/PF00025.16/3.7e-06,Arf/PF00025.16/1.4e+03,Gtr1_RagA/PF04670.7/1.5e-05,MMR_HSR1/PF01926.18/0.002,IIGP/PF05049.8/0.0031,Dynamin_N/PF00350.18/0.13,SRPRB/PF09439.5/0.19,SRPRB/PF09439.5/2.1e+03,AAA_17/PF13207.1/0.17,PduV-EutP/PF10662.4/0.65,PduV-EutP/PF10